MTEPAAAPAEWATQGARWPNRETSRFVRAGDLAWHVQVMGAGPAVLLVHGTGGATHSWRDVAPMLARRFTVVAPDLPGHGFTAVPARPERLSLVGMSDLVAALLRELDVRPALAVGHSAGAAVLLRMVADRRIAPAALVGFNAALEPPPALYGALVAPLVGPLASSALVAALAARAAAGDGVVRSLLRSTGSPLDDAQVARYAALFRSPARVRAVLTMMARWELAPLRRDLPALGLPVTLAAATDDAWVPAAVADDAARRLPNATVVRVTGGHLAHEVSPAEAVAIVEAAAAAAGVGAAGAA